MKPYYEHAGITIYHGDCREILPMIGSVGLVLTDPPYGISWDTAYSRFTRGTNDKMAVRNDSQPFDPSFLLDYGEVITWGANNYANQLTPASWLIWDKRCEDGFAFLSDAEVAWWNKGHGVYIFTKNAQQHRSTAGGLHPTQKPVCLMTWCIQKAKSTGTILDPFMGSGTTLLAAKNLGRSAVGIEIEEKYCEVAADRLLQETIQFGEDARAGQGECPGTACNSGSMPCQQESLDF